MTARGWLATALLLAGCSPPASERRSDTAVPTNANVTSPTAANVTAAPRETWPPAPGMPGGLPDDRRPLPEMNRDPAGPQGAAAVLETYAAAIEGGRWTRAHDSWGDPAAAAAFERRWRDTREVHAQIGAPSDAEGAAGSLYVTVPVQFYGLRNDGARFAELGSATIRRVNGVDGATARQLAWHIEQIEIATTPSN